MWRLQCGSDGVFIVPQKPEEDLAVLFNSLFAY
jgi:hypothetical protein